MTNIDLNKMEQQLDDALSSETKESLTNWINGQRARDTSELIEEKIRITIAKRTGIDINNHNENNILEVTKGDLIHICTNIASFTLSLLNRGEGTNKLLEDFAKAIDYLQIMNCSEGNITIKSFIPKMRKKYKLKSELE